MSVFITHVIIVMSIWLFVREAGAADAITLMRFLLLEPAESFTGVDITNLPLYQNGSHKRHLYFL